MISASTTSPTASLDAIPRPPEKCPFCGAELATVSVRFMERGKWVERGGLPCFGSCGCAGSKRKLEEMRVKRQAKGENLRARYRRAEIPERYVDAPVPCTDLLRAVQAGRGAWVHGPNGTGKSAYAASALMGWLGGGERGLYAYAPEALRRIASEFDEDSEAYYERLCETPLLVLDDLGKEEPTERRASALSAVVDARWGAKLPTVVTSNFAPSEWVARMGGSSTARGIASRLMQGAFAKTMLGADRRLA